MTPRNPASLTGLQQAFSYPRSKAGATTDLEKLLISEILEKGPMTYSSFMEQCLYHPSLGYYSRAEATTVSKMGDFMTSVSVGPVFGKLLARRLHRFWTSNGAPSRFTILELGAHDGSLAADVLSAAPEIDPAFARAISYVISEPLPARRDLLQKRFSKTVKIVSDPTDVSGELGAVLANEVLDALPVPLLLFSNGQWHEVQVTVNDEELDWTSSQTDCDLPAHYPEGYVTEGKPDLERFFKPLAQVFQKSLQLWVDYGLDEEALYHPARTAGTLRCFRNHQTKLHPLDHPGEQDLTADVNFTAVEAAALKVGLTPMPAMNQSRYLTYCARDWLLDHPTPKEINQFQTLIHPTQFGNRFYVLELVSGGAFNVFP